MDYDRVRFVISDGGRILSHAVHEKDSKTQFSQNVTKKFETNIIYQLVMMIYQLDINGYDVKYLHNFPLLIENIRQAKIENMIAIRKSNMSYLTVLPIISLLVVVFSLSLFILTLIGGSF